MFEKIDAIQDEEFQSHFLNYICVLISGYLEKELYSIIKDYKTTGHCKAHECKNNFQSIGKIYNAKWCAIRPIIMNIDASIFDKLQANCGDDFDEVIDSINNIVNTRHKIAYGVNVTNLTKNILIENLEKIELLIRELKNIFNNMA
ncbi:MAG: hypothetical protein Rsou_1626 [Candidatus Ruthia sp. Asou_11_S2]|nr:hypothetical protein [Candidatus Ruthia sp. Asou_11_S2]